MTGTPGLAGEFYGTGFGPVNLDLITALFERHSDYRDKTFFVVKTTNVTHLKTVAECRINPVNAPPGGPAKGKFFLFVYLLLSSNGDAQARKISTSDIALQCCSRRLQRRLAHPRCILYSI